MIDVKEQQQIETVYVEKIREALKQKQYSRATDLWSETESFIEQVTDGVNWYNVLENPDEEPGRIRRYYSNLHKDGQIHSQVLRQVGRLHQNNLYDLMNGPVKKALNV
jgi:serine carboxypeptidase 1